MSVVTAVFAEAFIRGRILYAVGFVPVLCFTVVTLLLYGVLRTVDRNVSALAAAFNLTGLFFEAIERHIQNINIALLFHGAYCLLIGYLVVRSATLPRPLGFLIALGGLGWMFASLPAHAGQSIQAYTVSLGFIGEGPLMLWLLVRGV
ncbi:MAG TPA: DUF4386 family protein [Bryobacteraceae bacterium]|nr:DUF4386 family protein [Bryobacteraceae bacterium]